MKAVLFPIEQDNKLELDWYDLTRRLTTHETAAPVLWWDAGHSFMVATPYDSVVTYVCGSVELIQAIQLSEVLEWQRLD